MNEITLEGLLRDILYQMSRADGQKAAAIANCFIKEHLNEPCFALPVSRLNELAKADKEERCVVLPCKLYDKIFFIENEQIKELEVESFHQWSSGHWKLQANTNKKYEHWKGYEIDFNGIGKTIFLTREEAEQVLKEMEQNEKI